MTLFFFSLSNDAGGLDGDEFADLDAARFAALQTALDVARHKSTAEIIGLYVSVTDESGEEVFRTPLRH